MDLRELASKKAIERGLDPDFVHRIIKQESRWNPKAESPVGARGLMQVMPGTGRDLGVTNPALLFDPTVSIDAGTKYLSQLSRQFGGNPHLVSMAYNAGPGRVGKLVKQYGSSPAAIFPHLPQETRHYAQVVAGPLSGVPPVVPRTVVPRAAAVPAVMQPTVPRPVVVAEAMPPEEDELRTQILNWVMGNLMRSTLPDSVPSVGMPRDIYGLSDIVSLANFLG